MTRHTGAPRLPPPPPRMRNHHGVGEEVGHSAPPPSSPCRTTTASSYVWYRLFWNLYRRERVLGGGREDLLSPAQMGSRATPPPHSGTSHRDTGLYPPHTSPQVRIWLELVLPPRAHRASAPPPPPPIAAHEAPSRPPLERAPLAGQKGGGKQGGRLPHIPARKGQGTLRTRWRRGGGLLCRAPEGRKCTLPRQGRDRAGGGGGLHRPPGTEEQLPLSRAPRSTKPVLEKAGWGHGAWGGPPPLEGGGGHPAEGSSPE